MLNYIFKRLLVAIPTIFVLIISAFFILRLAPGGPFTAERPLPPVVMKNVLERYGMDDTIWQQFSTYMKNLFFHFDFGPSFSFRDRTVNEIIESGFPVTLTYGFWSAVFVLVCGITIGIIAALRHNSFEDYIVTGLAIFSQIFPNFILAPLMVLLFTLSWQEVFGQSLLPGGGWNGGQWQFIIMPAIALGTSYMAGVARIVRGQMLEVMNSAYIRTARAKGLSDFHIVVRHALKPSLLPVVSYMGPTIVYMITGSVFIDIFFSTGGIGQSFIDSSYSRDYSVLMGLSILYVILSIAMNLIMDLIYFSFDPKLRSTL